ncbi:MAG: histidine kinase [Gammaproteobacteria bacterium]|nr:histidine kinase [Gammaproteobacteria bacterium]
MNIIASLISVDPETAEEVVEDLSSLFRASLNDSSDSPVPLVEEMDLCDKYVHIESLRLEDRLDVDWHVEVDVNEVRIPLLTLQPILENAIYHGIQPNAEGGTVTVSITEEGGYVKMSVRNPLPPVDSNHKEGNRMALDNIGRRLQAVYGDEARVTNG